MDKLFETNNEEVITLDENKKYVEELVGEGKKFKDLEALARGKYEADMTIEMMKRRQDELRNDYLTLREEHTAGAKLKDLIDQLAATKQQQLASNENTQVNEEKTPFDADQLDSLLDKKMEQREVARTRAQNAEKVATKLQATLGADYANVIQKKANSLGLSMEDVKELARKSPDAFFNTFELNQPREGFQSPPSSTVRNDNFSLGGKKRSWAYYQEMKKNTPKIYYDAKTQNQMIEDYRNLGKDFEDGNYSQI